MVDGTERQAVGPAAAEVGDVNVLHEEERIQKSIMFITSVLNRSINKCAKAQTHYTCSQIIRRKAKCLKPERVVS